jgi:hypothetical protein
MGCIVIVGEKRREEKRREGKARVGKERNLNKKTKQNKGFSRQSQPIQLKQTNQHKENSTLMELR